MRRYNLTRKALSALAVILVIPVLMLLAYVIREGWQDETPPSPDSEMPLFDVSLPQSSDTPPPSRSPSSLRSFTPPVLETPSPTPEVITAEPVRILIPAIGVDAEMVGTEKDEKLNTMAIDPSASTVSWYRERVIPGNEGNAILGGHNKWKGQKGVIADLGKLTIGDELTILYEDGTARRFCLESIFEYAYKTAPGNEIMSRDGPARITIITCSGTFNTVMGTSENRLVAIFRPEEVFVTPDPPVTPFPTRSG